MTRFGTTHAREYRLGEIIQADGEFWLILSTAFYPLQGKAYICAQMRRLPPHGVLIPVPPEEWQRGKPPFDMVIDPRTVQTIHHGKVTICAGEISMTPVLEARNMLKSYL